MWTFLLGVFFGLLASSRSDQLQVNSRSCSYVGVFIAEGPRRHVLDFNMGLKVCEQQESIMASPEQVQLAYDRGMETCRKGWLNNGSAAILRQRAHENCARNSTGFIITTLVAQTERFDVYCYDEEAGPGKNCTKRFVFSEQPQADAPAETSTQPLVSTTAESKAEPETPNSQPEDAPDSDAGNSTAVLQDDGGEEEAAGGNHVSTSAPFVPAEEPEVSTEAPDEGSSYRGNDNSTGDAYFTGKELDQDAGSGIQPFSEDQGAAPLTTVRAPEVTQHTTENGEQPGVSEESIKADYPHEHNDKGRVLGPDNGHEEGDDSSNWLVIIGVIVAVAAILFVCAAVAKRKSWCGRQQTLIITAKDGGEGNGTAAAASSSHNQDTEQEMVTLMNKENIQENGNTEEFTVITLEESPDKDQQA